MYDPEPTQNIRIQVGPICLVARFHEKKKFSLLNQAEFWLP